MLVAVEPNGTVGQARSSGGPFCLKCTPYSVLSLCILLPKHVPERSHGPAFHGSSPVPVAMYLCTTTRTDIDPGTSTSTSTRSRPPILSSFQIWPIWVIRVDQSKEILISATKNPVFLI